MMRPTIIDTDPGIDDAIAILLALAAGMDIRAVTTLGGNIGLAATTRNAGRVLALAGRGDIPVHPGAAAPLARAGRDETRIHGADGLGGVAFPDPAAPPGAEPAATAMARILMANPPGTVDLLALGPLTNVAALLRTAPDAARRLRSLIAMGGALAEPGNVGPRGEFNLAHDPEAAAEVLAAGLNLTLVPLDVTRRVRADAAWCAGMRAAGRPAATAAADLVTAYFDTTGGGGLSRPLHDPCVPALALRPGLFTVTDHTLGVALSGDAGALVPGPHLVRVATGVDGAGVLDLIGTALTA